jgi:hypothetical protein
LARVVRERLGRHVRDADEHHGRRRSITCMPSSRLTDHQLAARIRRFNGAERQRTIGV